MKPHHFILILVASFLLSGCLEHSYYFSVLPDDGVTATYKVSGDRADLEDGRELLPDSTLWNLQARTEEEEDRTIHILEGSVNIEHFADLTKTLDWRTKPDDTLRPQPVFSLDKKSTLFSDVWLFEARFPSRRFNELYGDIWDHVPAECRALDNDSIKALLSSDEIDMLEKKFALGIFQWNIARYERLFALVWSDVIAKYADKIKDTTELTVSISRTGWSDDIKRYLNDLDVGDPNLTNLDWWHDLRPVFLGRFTDLCGVDLLPPIADIANAQNLQYSITKDMEDDMFQVLINLPGSVRTTNGEWDEQNGLVSWELPGKMMADMELEIFAESVVWKPLQVSLAGAILLTLIIVLLFSIVRRKRSA